MAIWTRGVGDFETPGPFMDLRVRSQALPKILPKTEHSPESGPQ